MKRLLRSSVIVLAVSFYHVHGHAAAGISMAERVQQLTDLASKRSVLRFNSNKFKEYVRSTPRNYSVVVMFTAMASKRQCQFCRDANEEFTIVADSLRPSNQLFFALVDFDDGSDVFRMLRLDSAPVFMHFPPKGAPKKRDTLDVFRVGFSAEAISKWIFERTGTEIEVIRPPNYSGMLALGVLLVSMAGLLYLARNNLVLLCNKNTWGLAALVFTFNMVSGQMWNHIREPPFVHSRENGQIMYVHDSSHGQFIAETYIVIVLIAGVVFGMIFLTEAARLRCNPRRRKTIALVGLTLLSVFFSLLLSVFRFKTPDYPYSFLFY